MDITGGTVLGDDVLFYFMHVFSLECSSSCYLHLLKSMTVFNYFFNFQLLSYHWTPYTSHNTESEQRTLDLVVDTSHTQSH